MMRDRRLDLPRATLLASALMLAAATAAADPLRVVDDELDVSAGVLHVGQPGGGCCRPGSGACLGRFKLDNASDATVRDIGFEAGDLASGEGLILPAAALRFSPAGLPKLGPNGVHAITLKVEPPADAFAGSYRGAIRITAEPDVGLDLAVVAELCGPAATPSLTVVPGQGDYDGRELRLRPEPGTDGAADCAGTHFVGDLVVQNDGPLGLDSVAAAVAGWPAGIEVRFSPPSLILAPGVQLGLRVMATVPADLAAGEYAGTLAVRDGPTGASASVPARLTRCRDAAPGLAIVRPAGGELAWVAGQAGCSGEAFRLEVTVANTGQVVLGQVALAVAGLADGLAVTVEPERLSLEPGRRASFTLSALGTALPGVYQTTITARDGSTGASDSALARLTRCDGPDPGPGPGDGAASLVVSQRLSRSAARLGEVLTVTVTVENLGLGTAREVEVEEDLPRGLAYVSGRSALDGAAWDEPARSRSGDCRWRLPEVAASNAATLRFQVVVTTAARIGTLTARVWARWAGLDVGPAEVDLEVTRSSLRPFGSLRGRVRMGDGSGVDGVRLLLDSDREVVSGADGDFAFAGVLGGDHLISLDRRTLPAGSRLRSEDSRLLRLFDGADEQIEFVVSAGPRLGLALERVAPLVGSAGGAPRGPVEEVGHGR